MEFTPLVLRVLVQSKSQPWSLWEGEAPIATPPAFPGPKWPRKGGALAGRTREGCEGRWCPLRAPVGPGCVWRRKPSSGTYAGAGVLPLLSNQDVQCVVLLQVEDAQHGHAVGPRHGVPPAFSAGRSVA